MTLLLINLVFSLFALWCLLKFYLGRHKQVPVSGKTEKTSGVNLKVSEHVAVNLYQPRETKVVKQFSYQKILSDKIDRVSVLNDELAYCPSFESADIPENVINKMLHIALTDHGTNCVEVLRMVEFIEGKVRPQHLPHLKQLFIRFGSSYNLFDIAMYRAVYRCSNSQDKSEFLNLIQTVSIFTPDLIAAKTQMNEGSNLSAVSPQKMM